MKKYSQLKADIILDFYLDEICKFRNYKKSDVLKKGRKREYADVRAIATYLIKKQYSKIGLREIANFFNLENHATVLHSVTKIETLKNQVAEIRQALEHCEKLNFDGELLKSHGFKKVDTVCFSKKVNDILDIQLDMNELQNCTFRFTGHYSFYEIKNIDIFDAIIISKNINSNPLGVLINSLKN